MKPESSWYILHTKQESTMLQLFEECNKLDVVEKSDEDVIFDDAKGAPAISFLESDSRQTQKQTAFVLLSVDEDIGEDE